MEKAASMRTDAGQQKRWIGLLLAGAGVVLAGAVLFFFNPAEHGFYPFCFFHRITGLLCPGCGSLRAIHQLLHGNIIAAFHLNALLVLLAPLAGWALLREAVWQVWGKKVPGPRLSALWGWFLLLAFILFGILRNL